MEVENLQKLNLFAILPLVVYCIRSFAQELLNKTDRLKGNRHLVELDLAIMYRVSVPFRYWIKAFYTINFLINLLSFVAQNMQSLYTIYLKELSYSMLKTLGSSRYPYLRNSTANKFEHKSLPCVFLCYNEKLMGYRCLYCSTRRVYISRHAIFDEYKFPFANGYSQPTQVKGELCHFDGWYNLVSPTTLNQPTPPPDLDRAHS